MQIIYLKQRAFAPPLFLVIRENGGDGDRSVVDGNNVTQVRIRMDLDVTVSTSC